MVSVIELPAENSVFTVSLETGQSLQIRLILRDVAGYWTIDFIDIEGRELITDIPLIQCSDLTSQFRDFHKKYGVFFCVDSEVNVPLEEALNRRFTLLWRQK